MRIETLKCRNCNRLLVDIMVNEGTPVWRITAVCGYPDCGDKSFETAVTGRISLGGHSIGEKAITRIARHEELTERHVTLFTKPV